MEKNKRKEILIMSFIILIILAAVIIKVIKENTVESPEFNGRVIDSVTGEPIEKVVIIVNWMGYGKKLFGGPSGFRGMKIITGKDGRYKIPGYKEVRFFADIDCIMIIVHHPLYAPMKDQNLPWAIWPEQYAFSEGVRASRLPNGTIQYDIKMLGVEEAIKRGAEEYEKTKSIWAGFNFGGFIGSYSGSFFKEHWDKRFVEDVLKKWEEIFLIRGGKNRYVKDQLKKIKKEVDEAYREGN